MRSVALQPFKENSLNLLLYVWFTTNKQRVQEETRAVGVRVGVPEFIYY